MRLSANVNRDRSRDNYAHFSAFSNDSNDHVLRPISQLGLFRRGKEKSVRVFRSTSFYRTKGCIMNGFVSSVRSFRGSFTTFSQTSSVIVIIVCRASIPSMWEKRNELYVIQLNMRLFRKVIYPIFFAQFEDHRHSAGNDADRYTSGTSGNEAPMTSSPTVAKITRRSASNASRAVTSNDATCGNANAFQLHHSTSTARWKCDWAWCHSFLRNYYLFAMLNFGNQGLLLCIASAAYVAKIYTRRFERLSAEANQRLLPRDRNLIKIVTHRNRRGRSRVVYFHLILT